MAQYTPRLIFHPSGQAFADIDLLLFDLRHVVDCCNEFCSLPLGQTGDFKGVALFDSALVRYRRCFTSGVRTRVVSWEKHLTDENKNLHKYFLHVCNKHIAHSINSREEAVAVFYVAELEDGRLDRGSLGSIAHRMSSASKDEMVQLRDLTLSLVDFLVVKRKSIASKLNDHFDSLSDAEVRALPINLGHNLCKPIQKARKARSGREVGEL